mgnify:CR=1 FL=1
MTIPTRAYEFYRGVLATWNGRTFGYSQAFDNSPNQLKVLPGDPIPDGFERQPSGSYSRAVAAAEVSQVFVVKTFCRIDEERFLADAIRSDGWWIVEWTRSDPERGPELGLTQYEYGGPWTGAFPPDRVDEVWQERYEVGEPLQRARQLDREHGRRNA